MEKNPYNARNINDKTYDYFFARNIDVVWSNPDEFSLNHAKFIIIDDELILSTGNLSFSTFSSNRDLFLFI